MSQMLLNPGLSGRSFFCTKLEFTSQSFTFSGNILMMILILRIYVCGCEIFCLLDSSTNFTNMSSLTSKQLSYGMMFWLSSEK